MRAPDDPTRTVTVHVPIAWQNRTTLTAIKGGTMLSDSALVTAANAIDAAVTHFQLHSGARGASGTTNTIGTRVAVNGSVDADGDITWTNVAFTGLTANQPVAEVSYWTASSGGTYYGGTVLTGDTTANSAGEFTVNSVTENSTGT